MSARVTVESPATLRSLFGFAPVRALVPRMMVTRLGTAAFGTGLATVVAVHGHVPVVPGGSWSMSGVAALGVISTASSAGALAANGVGQRLVERRGVTSVLRWSAVAQAVVAVFVGALVVTVGLTGAGIVGLVAVAFLFAAASPGLSGLARAWWSAIGLPELHAARGGALEPTLSAIAWSLGPALGAPVALVAPWTIPIFGLAAAAGLAILSVLPNPYAEQAAGKARDGAGPKALRPVAEWWMAGTYAFYHVARGLLGMGSTAVLVAAHQASLSGAASAAPSIGHVAAGVAYAARAKQHGHKKAVLTGLAGQAVPTLVMAGVLTVWPTPGAVVGAVLVVGGNFVAGVLKAPVASAVYPLASMARPGTPLGRSSARLSQGMTVGGLVGPLLGTVIVATVGAGWLLPASAISLGVCAVGVLLDARVTAGPRAQS